MLRDEVLPLLRLRELVGLPAYVAASAIDLEHVVVIDLATAAPGWSIDELTGQEEIVVKQFDARARRAAVFRRGHDSSATARPALIVDVSSLL